MTNDIKTPVSQNVQTRATPPQAVSPLMHFERPCVRCGGGRAWNPELQGAPFPLYSMLVSPLGA